MVHQAWLGTVFMQLPCSPAPWTAFPRRASQPASLAACQRGLRQHDTLTARRHRTVIREHADLTPQLADQQLYSVRGWSQALFITPSTAFHGGGDIPNVISHVHVWPSTQLPEPYSCL